MYERLLNKQEIPTFDDLIRYGGENGGLWIAFDKYMEYEFKASSIIRFPYGNKYGWSKKYSIKSKHICDVFAENGAFMALFKMLDSVMETIYDDLSEYAKSLWDNKYTCSNGGWLNFRVINAEQLEDLKKIIYAKIMTHSK